MNDYQQVVLPDTLVAQLIDNAATLSNFLEQDFVEIVSERHSLREALIAQKRIAKINLNHPPLKETFAIDGAHLAEIDRASAYSASCAVSVGQSHQSNDQSSCLAILPHVPSLNSISSSLMMMQEIMMSVKIIENHPQAVCLIDGSKISAIIAINQFYTGINRDLPDQLSHWRLLANSDPEREPGKTLALFESRDWLTPYLTSTRIVGNLKLVTSTTLVENYAKKWIGRFDDKTLAALALKQGEALGPIELPPPKVYYHIDSSYPFSRSLASVEKQLYEINHDNQILHVYYMPHEFHGVFKIEMNKSFLNNAELSVGLFSWWFNESRMPDLHEPYSFYIADRFAKEAVSVAKNALREIARRNSSVTSWAWFFTQPYRTE